MTAREAIERARVFRPNAAKDEVMLSWLSELEGRVHVEIFLLDVHDTAPIFDMDTELYAKYPHDAIYEAYLIMQTDLYHKEYEAFSASRMRFDELWGVFARYMATYHRPADDAKRMGRGASCDRVGHTLGTVQPFWSTKEAYIGVNGNWWYGGLDTGIKGIGRDGLDGEAATIDVEKTDDGIRLILKDSRGTSIAEIKNGITPHIENGMWYIGDQNTGIKAESVDGYTPQKGVDYFTEEDKAELKLTVDQSYSADSENAQSGKAMAEAMNYTLLSETEVTQEAFDGAGEEGITIVSLGSQDLELSQYDEIALQIHLPDSSAINAESGLLQIRFSSGEQYQAVDADLFLSAQSTAISTRCALDVTENNFLVKGVWVGDTFLYGEVLKNGYRGSQGYAGVSNCWNVLLPSFLKSQKKFFHVKERKGTFKFPVGTTIKVYGR